MPRIGPLYVCFRFTILQCHALAHLVDMRVRATLNGRSLRSRRNFIFRNFIHKSYFQSRSEIQLRVVDLGDSEANEVRGFQKRKEEREKNTPPTTAENRHNDCVWFKVTAAATYIHRSATTRSPARVPVHYMCLFDDRPEKSHH